MQRKLSPTHRISTFCYCPVAQQVVRLHNRAVVGHPYGTYKLCLRANLNAMRFFAIRIGYEDKPSELINFALVHPPVELHLVTSSLFHSTGCTASPAHDTIQILLRVDKQVDLRPVQQNRGLVHETTKLPPLHRIVYVNN